MRSRIPSWFWFVFPLLLKWLWRWSSKMKTQENSAVFWCLRGSRINGVSLSLRVEEQYVSHLLQAEVANSPFLHLLFPSGPQWIALMVSSWQGQLTFSFLWKHSVTPRSNIWSNVWVLWGPNWHTQINSGSWLKVCCLISILYLVNLVLLLLNSSFKINSSFNWAEVKFDVISVF